jgi:DNA polymerase
VVTIQRRSSPDPDPVLLFVDIESYSSSPVPEVGAFRYAECPDTELLGLGILAVTSLDPLRDQSRRFAGRVDVLHCYRGDRVSDTVQRALQDPTAQVVSWGNFDRILLDEAGIGEAFGWPRAVPERWVDAMDLARACNLPDGLDAAAKAVGLTIDGVDAQKDKRGKQLIKRYCMPQKNGIRHRLEDNPQDAAVLLDAYMAMDVTLLARLYAVLPPLSEAEQRVAEATWQMNRRGVRIDTDLAHALVRARDWSHERARVAVTQRHGINIRAPLQVMAALKSYGFPLPTHLKTGQPSIEQKLVSRVLDRLGDQADPRARDLLNLRMQCNGTSLSKVDAALARVCRDGRVRDQFIYRGTVTDRWASREIQLQNLPRPRFATRPEDVETLTTLFKLCGDPEALPELVMLFFGVSLQDAAISLLRSLIIPDPDHVIIIADYKAIEVVTNWMAAGEYSGLAALSAGKDEYRNFAKTLLSRIETLYPAANDPDVGRNLAIALQIVSAKPRDIGKVGLLSIQYGTSAYGLAAQSNIPVPLAELMIGEYGDRYPVVAKHQRALVEAAVQTMRSLQAGHVVEWRVPPLNLRFRYRPAVPGTDLDALEMLRPSGEGILYLRPRVAEEQRRGVLRAAVTHQVYDVGTKTYRRELKLTDQAENCASSLARDVVAEKLVKLVAVGLCPILAVHDEIAIEVPVAQAQEALQRLKEIMEQPPLWWDMRAPLRTEAAIVPRYQKI